MSKKLIYLISFVLVLSIAGNASAELVAHWQLPVHLISHTLSLGIRLFCNGPMFV